MPRLIVIGSTNVDLFAHVTRHPSPGETLMGTGGERAAGGKGANQALAAALQGAQVSFVGAVGDDADADTALAAMRDAGVDLAGVETADAPTGLAIITVSDHGENTIVVIAGANATVSPDRVTQVVDTMAADDLLLLQGEIPRESIEAAVRAAAATQRRTVLNVAPWTTLAKDVLTAADPLVLNEHEAALAIAELGVTPADDSPSAAATALRQAGVRSVVITLGSDGAALADDDATTHTPSPTVTAVDSAGAGDAFTGALAARLLQGETLSAAVAHAVRVGAYAVQHQGAQPSYPAADAELPG